MEKNLDNLDSNTASPHLWLEMCQWLVVLYSVSKYDKLKIVFFFA